MQLRRIKPNKAHLRVATLSILIVMCTLVILSAVFPFPEGTWDFLSIGMSEKASANPDWLSGWSYRKSHSLTGATGAGTNYQVAITVHSGSGSDSGDDVYLSGHCTDFPNDICFTDNDGATELDYWCENLTAGPAVFWIEVADDLGSNQVIYIYYGKSGEDSGINGINTFPIWEHFDEWEAYSGNPVLAKSGSEERAFASVLKVGSTYHMYYSYWTDGTIYIGHATSSDGKTSWTVDTANNPVLSPGSATWEDEKVLCPWVWVEDSTWHMIYHGRGTVSKAIGHATSSDGLDWSRDGSNPILTGSGGGWEGSDVENWGVHKVGSTYYMWYESPYSGTRQEGLATATNLSGPWTKDGNNPIFTGSRFCGSTFKYGSYYYHIIPHGTSVYEFEIELWRDTNPTFYSGNREFVKTIKGCPGVSGGGWDTTVLDTPMVLTDDIECDTFTASGGELWLYYAGANGGSPYEWQTGLLIEPDPTKALQRPSQFTRTYSAIADQVNIYDGKAILGIAGQGIDSVDSSAIGKAMRFRAKLHTGATSINSIGGLANDGASGGDFSDFAGLRSVHATWDWAFTTRASSGTVYGTDVSSYTTPGSYQIYEIFWKSGEAKLAINGTVRATHSDGVSTANLDSIFEVDDRIDVDWVLVRKYVDPEPGHGAWGSEETESPEITNTPGSNDFGILEVNTTSNTAINYFTIENTGNCNVDVVIYGTDATGGDDTWDLADDGSPGENIYALRAGLDDDDDAFDVIVKEVGSTPYLTLVSNLAESATQDWGLQILMPTSLSGYDAQQMSGTITLVASSSS